MQPTPLNLRSLLTVFCLTSTLLVSARADLVLETETAELGKKGDMLVSQGIQFEREKDGSKTTFLLTQFEYAITDRAEILIEPFFQEWDNPKDGKAFHGIGDLEITPSYMIVLEKPYVPAIVLAFKLKVPMAKNREIGTGKFDYQPYIILGKKYKNWVFNFNFGYDFITARSKEEQVNNQFIYDFSVEYKVTPKWSVFAEVFANSKPTNDSRGTFAGAVATEYQFSEHISGLLSVGYDTDHLLAVRPGINITF